MAKKDPGAAPWQQKRPAGTRKKTLTPASRAKAPGLSVRTKTALDAFGAVAPPH
jgi:hypothetical protein